MFRDSDKPLEDREYLDESDLDESPTCLIPSNLSVMFLPPAGRN
jgi:hypothetical protein